MAGFRRCAHRTGPLSLCGMVLGLFLVQGCASWSQRTPAWEQPPPPLKEGPVVPADALTRTRLANGLVVLILEDHRLPMVNLALTVRSGAGSVDPSQAGLAELTAELMNRGAGDRDALALAEAVDARGASLSVSAGWDSISAQVSGLSRDMDFLLGVLADVVLVPRFDPGEVEKARSEQLAGLEAANDNPGELVRREAMAALYSGHRYGVSLSGLPESVKVLDAKNIRALHAGFFVPANAILSVSGDVDPKRVLAQLSGNFKDWDSAAQGPFAGATTPPPPTPTPARRRIVIADKPDLNQARIILGHEGIARDDPRRLTASVLNATFGGSGFSSRLMKKLRSEAGLTYGVRSGFAMRAQPGPFTISTFTRVAETRRAVDMLLEELAALQTTQPQSADELAKAKSYMVGQFGLGLETSQAVLSSLVNLEVYGLPADSLDTYRTRISAITAKQTRQVADELLHPSRAAIVLLGPAEVLAPEFEDLGSVEIVTP